MCFTRCTAIRDSSNFCSVRSFVFYLKNIFSPPGWGCLLVAGKASTWAHWLMSVLLHFCRDLCFCDISAELCLLATFCIYLCPTAFKTARCCLMHSWDVASSILFACCRSKKKTKESKKNERPNCNKRREGFVFKNWMEELSNLRQDCSLAFDYWPVSFPRISHVQSCWGGSRTERVVGHAGGLYRNVSSWWLIPSI